MKTEQNHYVKVFLLAVLAGICIGLGGTVFLRLKDTFPGANVAGALMFGIGLFTICTRGYSLFTGKVCAVPDNPPAYLAELGVIWLGNLAGTAAVACLELPTGLCGGDSGIDRVAASMVNGKMQATFLSLFLLGALCNILIYIAVYGYREISDPVGKYLALFLGVAVFILAGTEHSIADMYYWMVSGALFASPGASLVRIIVITLGNSAGGILFRLLEKAAKDM